MRPLRSIANEILLKKLLCGSPGIRITANVWSIAFGGSPVVADVCFYVVSAYNVTVPDFINPVCIGVFASLPGSVPLSKFAMTYFWSHCIDGKAALNVVEVLIIPTKEETKTVEH